VTSEYDIFLSYSRADGDAAQRLRVRLKEAGLNPFLDVYGLPAGQPWLPWLEQQLGTCRALVVLLGPKGFGEWQHREIWLGLDRQASDKRIGRIFPVIPVLLPGLAKGDAPIGTFLALNTWVDLGKGLDHDPQELARLIAGAQGAAIDAAAAENLITALPPYRGLLPFREQDAGLFFGRHRFVEELVQKVKRTNVVAVIGRSGCGKSSIVCAGLFPALRRERGLNGQSVWQIIDLRPYGEPLQQLAHAFDPPKEEPDSMEWEAALNKKANLFRNRDVTLAQLVRNRLRKDAGSTRLLLYVDQWEELYTLAMPREIKSDADRTRVSDIKLFIDLLLGAAAESPCTLVFSVPSDFYPDLQTHDDLRVAVQNEQVSLGKMNEAELRDIIEGPPKALGATVDPELTDRLVHDIGIGRDDEYDIRKLPLLEYALQQAWAKRMGPQIGVTQYSGLEHALEERANAIFDHLSEVEQAAAKRLFVSMVRPGEAREHTRARVLMPNDAATRAVVRAFAGWDARLVVTDQVGELRSVEISHEALIRYWKKLQSWIDDNREKLRTRDLIREYRVEWLMDPRDPTTLSLPRSLLKKARELYEQPGDVIIDEIWDFLDAVVRYQRAFQESVRLPSYDEREKLRTRDLIREYRVEWLLDPRDPTTLSLPKSLLKKARELYEQPGDVNISEIWDYLDAVVRYQRAFQENVRLPSYDERELEKVASDFQRAV
jgi:hypothetical protein